MTGKRPRTLRRTSSESLIESVSFTQECSPLPEHPKEKLKPTPVKEPVPAAPPPRLVIGFNPKPLPENAGNGCLKPSSPGSSSSAKSSSSSSYPPSQQRSGLESLLSVPRERKVVEGVGLSIVAAMNNNTAVVQEELKSSNIVDRRNQRNHHHHHQHVVPAAAATKTDSILHSRPNPYCTIAQKQSMSIPILRVPDSSGSYHKSGRPSQHRFSGGVQQPPLAGAADGQGGRAMVAWLRQADPEEGERDTFLLRTSSSFKTQQVVVVPDAVAAAAASAVHFLDACYFCKRHLVDGKDIYMYRGDKAFCSTECRSQQIMLDERHENCLVAALKKTSGAPSHRNRVVAAAGTAAAA
ncbi:hypothetical protein BDL97_05G079100 [Sphagnum fallax]|nr:hypothetical protein BDL97_05G079100 [Sphagnum fallax]